MIKNRIAIILDRSSSMMSIRQAAIDMYNEQVRTISAKNEGMDTRVSLFTFADCADEPKLFNEHVQALRPLETSDYVPFGNTAMYDAIGLCIDKFSALSEASDKDSAFLVVVVTDGQENNSRHFTAAAIGDRIKLLQSTGKWTFTFLGANVDVEKMSKELHIPRANTMSFVASTSGTFAASTCNASGMSNYLQNRQSGIGGQSAGQNFYQNAPTNNETDDLVNK